MPLDCIFIHHLCNELRERLCGARVDKIHHPAKEEFVLHLRTRAGNHRLLICVNPARARAGIIAQAVENPAQPSMLCMLLRKRLTGAQLTDVRQQGPDRVICFDFAGTDLLGEPARHALCAEFTGRHANLILINEDDVILDAAKRVPEQALWTEHSEATEPHRRWRAVLPGIPYAPPPDNGFVPPAIEGEARPMLLRDAQGVPMKFGYAPQGGNDQGWEEIESYSRLLEIFYREKDQAQRAKQRTSELLKLCETRARRARRRAEAQRLELARAQDREHLRVCAELIFANRARLESDPGTKGGAAYLLENYYDRGSLLSIPADPALSPAANAQKYYKEYRKAKTAASLLGELIEKGEAEAQYLESAADLLARAETQAEIGELRAELEEQGYCKPRSGPKKKQPKALPPLEYTSAEGLRILVGRSNAQNDRLSLKIARGGDLWFHAHEMPGSHVILCAQGGEPGERSIEEAAMLAAWHSRARGRAAQNAACAVDYTPAKALKKPPGAPPGKVIYHAYRTILVTPNREMIEMLSGENERSLR